ncbi:hypothetical protein CSUI_004891 [Cystoisospora suis]|uniref:Transmembrane protein n=1 Tax=Cystoisospora suis TaxID=483139 RepID=A0A2C6KX45_9APIC|nr:hypothetical protein CSUI_004891 [Cystoisospora suis]
MIHKSICRYVYMYGMYTYACSGFQYVRVPPQFRARKTEKEKNFSFFLSSKFLLFLALSFCLSSSFPPSFFPDFLYS